MDSTSKVHVMALSPEYQLALRLLLNINLKYQMRYVLDYLVLNPSFVNVDKKWSTLKQALDMYEELAGEFPTLKSVSNGRIKLFAYNTMAMNFILSAVQRYSETDHADLDHEEIDFLNHTYDELKSLLEDSLKHEYTLDEVRKAHTS